ncbi:MAG: sugar ABC transporter substrate-binding protein [Actinobacteria bacterium]|nr:sugar ABC transporter substrate-binding protein [Actinomycetota bacterium]
MKRILIYVITITLLFSMVFIGIGCKEETTEESSEEVAVDVVDEEEPSDEPETTTNYPVEMGIELKNLDLDGTLNGQFEGKKIVIGTVAGELEQSLKDNKSYFEELTGGTVEINSFPGESFMEKIQMDLSIGGVFDVVLMPVALIHGYAYTGLVQDLAPLMDMYQSPNYDIDDFFPGLFDTYAKYGGKLVAIPFKPDAQMFFYREDLFNNEQVKEQFKDELGRELTVPKTPEELLEVAKFFTKEFNPNSPVTYGFSAMGSKGNSRWLWVNRLGYYGGDDVDENYNPAFNNEAGIKAMEFLDELKLYAPPQWQEFKWEEANNFFIRGDVAMMEQWPGLWYSVEGDNSDVKGKVNVSVTPGGTPTLGGWALAISSTSEESEMAFKYIEYCTSKDGEILKIKNTMDPCRVSNLTRPEIIESNPLYPALIESLEKATILADVDVPIISFKLNDVMELAIQDLFNGNKTPQEAVEWMAAEFEKEIENLDLE